MATGRANLIGLAAASGRAQYGMLQEERAKYEALVEQERLRMEERRREGRKRSKWGMVGKIGGGILGGVVGSLIPGAGPLGVMAGASLGAGLGGTLAGGAATGDYAPDPMEQQLVTAAPNLLLMQYLYGGKPNPMAQTAMARTAQPSLRVPIEPRGLGSGVGAPEVYPAQVYYPGEHEGYYGR